MRSTILLCRPRVCSSFHKALRSTESKAALRSSKAMQIRLWNSFLLWMTVLNVIINDNQSLTDQAWTHSGGGRTKVVPYQMVEKVWRYVHLFTYHTRTRRTDGRSDKRTDGISKTISRSAHVKNLFATSTLFQIPAQVPVFWVQVPIPLPVRGRLQKACSVYL